MMRSESIGARRRDTVTADRRNFPQFFITAPAPCPYLPGRLERKVFTHLIGPEARALNSQLSQGGFRRSQNIAYRPACDGCASCISVRVRAQEFRPTASQRRIVKRNADLRTGIAAGRASNEQYNLFRTYIEERHGEGGMADMSILDFGAMVSDGFTDSRLIEYRIPGDDKPLVAAVLSDVLDDGISLIYSFYDPRHAWRSLGSFMILDHIERARRAGLPYVYLGYWVRSSRKMSYKANFLPQERLSADGWVLAAE
jgi:arginine-tRNA-protein transferase